MLVIDDRYETASIVNDVQTASIMRCNGDAFDVAVADGHRGRAEMQPMLWTRVLDRMAGDGPPAGSLWDRA